MNSTDTRCRVYGPEAIETMGWAFDKALESLSQESKQQPNMCRDLALCMALKPTKAPLAAGPSGATDDSAGMLTVAGRSTQSILAHY